MIGTYGKQYYVDVPAQNPLVRFIMISPSLNFPDGTYTYPAGSARYQWVSTTIDTARAKSIPWVVVGMHKPCITVGPAACDAGSDLFNLLLSKKVDLVLSGHDHTYQRSHQLGLRTGCTTFTPAAFDADCIVDSDSTFVAGAGTVDATVGTGGNSLYDVDPADAEAGYFAVVSGAHTNPTYGVLDVTATADSLQASFVRGAGGTLTDSFSITKGVTPPNSPPVAAFTSSCTNLTCTFDGSASSDPDGTISSYAWDFGDGTTGTGATPPAHAYAAAGSYTVGLTVTDNGGATGATSQNVAPTAPAVTTYAADAFTRTVAGGFGTAPTGGAWTFTGNGANLSVNGTGNFKLAAGASQAAYLASVSAPSSDVRVSYSLDKAPAGGTVYLSTYGRRIVGQGAYAARAKITSSGAVTLDLFRLNASNVETSLQAATAIAGLSYASGDTLNLRMQVLGGSPTTVQAKVWKAGSPEPGTWQKVATDSTAGLQAAGSFGLSPYVSSGATNGPITVRVDDLTITAP